MSTNWSCEPNQVVPYISAPAYEISNILVDIIRHTYKFKPMFHIKNLQKITKSEINSFTNAKLISFDVQNLFTPF